MTDVKAVSILDEIAEAFEATAAALRADGIAIAKAIVPLCNQAQLEPLLIAGHTLLDTARLLEGKAARFRQMSAVAQTQGAPEPG